MKYVAILILISFVGLAAFSMAVFDHGMNGRMNNCIGSQFDNTPCPTNLVASVIHHISAYQALFNALMLSANSLALLALLMLVSVLIFLSFKNFADFKLKFLYQRLRDFELITHKARRKFISWLSLFEHSPSIR